MSKKLSLLVLFFTLFISFYLRFSNVASFPPSLNWDEASLGYNAWSVAVTGKDEWNLPFPTIFRAFGDYKLPVYIYMLAPLTLFSQSIMIIRIISVVSGTVLVLVVYLLMRFLGFSRSATNFSAAILGLNPWGIGLSRAAFEANLGVTLFFISLVLSIRKRNSLHLIFLALSAWTYNSFRVIAPMTYIFTSQKNKKTFTWFLMLFVPIFIQMFTGSGLARFRWTTILDEGAIQKINVARSIDGSKILHNKLTFLVSAVSKNYLSHFSPNFLFISGGSNYQFNIPNSGLFYEYLLPLFYLGVFISILNIKKYRFRFILLILLISIVPSALTRDSPHTLRAIAMLPISCVFISIIKFKKYSLLLIIPVLFSAFAYLHSYQTSYATTYSEAWQYGHQEVVSFIKENINTYDEIIFTKRYGEPHIFLLMYWPYSPSLYQNDSTLNRYGRSDWFWVDAFSKFKFVNDWEMIDKVKDLNPTKKYLIISSPDNTPTGDTIKVINFLDNASAFVIKSK